MHALNADRTASAALVFALGVVISATLTPGREALEAGAVGLGTCDLSRIGFPSPAELTSVNETSLNVLLYVPLGGIVGIVASGYRGRTLAMGTFFLPVAIELLQVIALPLDRQCQSADMVDNVTGLALGLAAAVTIGRPVLGRLRPARSMEGDAV